MLPADGHVHTQFSWDARAVGDMHATCARAAALGLPSVAFTEHVDPGPWTVLGEVPPDTHAGTVDEHGRFLAAPLDVAAYLEEVDRCRRAFPGLRVLTGVEWTEPHRHPDALAALLAAAGADLDSVERVVGSVHTLPDLAATSPGGAVVEVPDAHAQRPALEVVTAYLTEVTAMAAGSASFAVLGHVDYPLRSWPADAGLVPWDALEEPFRAALQALAASGRALEVNTRLPLEPRVVTWWREAGGEAVTFGSDAHLPAALAHGFAEAAAMVEARGFRPGRTPHDWWARA